MPETQKHPEDHTLELGGKKRTIRLNAGSFRLAKIKHGVTISLAELMNPSLETLAQLVWIGMLPGDPDLKEEEVVLWIAQSDDQNEILGAVVDAIDRMNESMDALGKKRQGKAKR